MSRYLSFALLSLWCSMAWSSQPVVLATIKPLQLIAQSITHGVTEAATLLPAHVDPHAYALKPSDIRRLHNADLVIQVGPGFETYLTKTMVTLESSKQVVTMSREHNLAGDGHYWMSPVNAGQLAKRITAALLELDPGNAEIYLHNQEVFLAELGVVDQRIRADLEQLEKRAYLVYHGAYQSFEAEYGLQAAAEIRPHEEIRAGAKHLSRLRGMVEEQGLNCIVVPPGPLPMEVSIVTGDNKVQYAVLDPLARDTDAGHDGYIRFIAQTSQRIMDCLR